jgi:CheY-like chemotaxis protein
MARVLLVDTDDASRAILRAMFEHRGHEVREAASGEEGIELTGSFRPDVIIGDFPLDVPGYSPFTRAARAGGRNPLLVSWSTRATEEEVERAREVADAAFTKPASPTAIADAVERLLRE